MGKSSMLEFDKFIWALFYAGREQISVLYAVRNTPTRVKVQDRSEIGERFESGICHSKEAEQEMHVKEAERL